MYRGGKEDKSTETANGFSVSPSFPPLENRYPLKEVSVARFFTAGVYLDADAKCTKAAKRRWK